ncbi:serine/threonine-protein kinase [Hyalangium gracile]|uniref:serine/threonine-protein kinase n=1 Tax=Hyalangium gracile TaxID=394092 RepID=UPI001CCDC037|nr:protein kinase [Hyalangium gracile]
MTTSAVTHAHPHADLVPEVLVGPWRIRERWDRGSFGMVFRVERAAQYPYLVMERVEGMPLYEWAREARRTSRQVLRVLEQLASALAAAHALGGVHRDVKGDNVLVTSEGRAVLLDWGCAIHPEARPVTESSLGPGTPSYRSPESLRWHWAHRRTGERYEPQGGDDVYALGVTAYRLVTGTYPPPVEEVSGPSRRLLPPKDFATVSSGLDALLLACLAEEPLRRPRASSLAAALGHAAQQPEASAPIDPTPSAADTERASRPGPPLRRPSLAWGLGLLGGWTLVVLLVVAGRALRASNWSGLVESRGPSREVPDGGVGEEALASVEAARAGLPPVLALGRPMPTKPQEASASLHANPGWSGRSTEPAGSSWAKRSPHAETGCMTMTASATWPRTPLRASPPRGSHEPSHPHRPRHVRQRMRHGAARHRTVMRSPPAQRHRHQDACGAG